MLQFGEFILDINQARLFNNDDEVAIEPKLMALLLLFVNHPNTIISRKDILEKVWADSLVTDNAVNKMVAKLRKVLSDNAQNPQYIQTIPKRGYRLICEMIDLQDNNSSQIDQPAIETPQINGNNKRSEINFHRNKVIAILLLVLLVLSIMFSSQLLDSNSPNTSSYSISLTRANGAEESARMHANAKYLYFLKRSSESSAYSLFIKDIETTKITEVDIGNENISIIVAIVDGPNDETSKLIYLNKKPESCGVYQALITNNTSWLNTEKLFACDGKRVKDLDYHVSKKVIYYAAQPENFWPNQIYSYNITTQQHSFVTQVEPQGWGHHSIDISPDGNKLLIMSTDSDHKTQLLALNLLNNEITEGITFDYHVSEAIWHHDSKQVLYYGAAPAQQIIKSDLDGENASSFVSLSESLAPRMSLFPDGKNLLFSTERKNLSNRWLVPPKNATLIDNSTVADVYPSLFHHSSRYLFISKRSGRWQLYLGQYKANKAEIISNLSSFHWMGYLAISADDSRILLNAENKVYLIPISDLNKPDSLTTLKDEHIIFTSIEPIIAVDWLSENKAAITSVNSGIPTLRVVNLLDNKIQATSGKWAYGLTDQQHPEYHYYIEQRSNTLFRSNSISDSDLLLSKQENPSNTQITLPEGFFHVKIDANMLYYGSNENGIDYLNAVSLNNTLNAKKYPLNGFSSYDVSNGNIILSDIESLEGDVHRTMN